MKIKPRSGKSIVKKNNNEILFSVTKTGRKDDQRFDANLYFPNSMLDHINARHVFLEFDNSYDPGFPTLTVTFDPDGEFSCRACKNKFIITFPYIDVLPLVRPAQSCEIIGNPNACKFVLALPCPPPMPSPIAPPDAEPYPYLEDILKTLKEIKVLLSSK